MNEDIQRGKRKIRPVVSKVASVANLTHDGAIAGELGVESVFQVQRWGGGVGFDTSPVSPGLVPGSGGAAGSSSTSCRAPQQVRGKCVGEKIGA